MCNHHPSGPAPAHARGEVPGVHAGAVETTAGGTVTAAAPFSLPVATTTVLLLLTEEPSPLPSLSVTS